MGYTLPKRPQSVMGILYNSLLLYRTSFLSLFPFNILYACCLVLGAIMGQYVVVEHVIQWPIFGGIILTQWVTLCFLLSMLSLIQYRMFEARRNYKRALFLALKRWFPCLIVTIITFTMSFLGLLVLILPGIVLYVLLDFSLFAVLFEGDSIIDAMKRSARLVRPHFWQTFVIIALMLGLTLGIVFGVQQLSLLYSPEIIDAFGIPGFFMIGVRSLIFFFVIPWVFMVLISQYYNLKCYRRTARALPIAQT